MREDIQWWLSLAGHAYALLNLAAQLSKGGVSDLALAQLNPGLLFSAARLRAARRDPALRPLWSGVVAALLSGAAAHHVQLETQTHRGENQWFPSIAWGARDANYACGCGITRYRDLFRVADSLGRLGDPTRTETLTVGVADSEPPGGRRRHAIVNGTRRTGRAGRQRPAERCRFIHQDRPWSDAAPEGLHSSPQSRLRWLQRWGPVLRRGRRVANTEFRLHQRAARVPLLSRTFSCSAIVIPGSVD